MHPIELVARGDKVKPKCTVAAFVVRLDQPHHELKRHYDPGGIGSANARWASVEPAFNHARLSEVDARFGQVSVGSRCGRTGGRGMAAGRTNRVECPDRGSPTAPMRAESPHTWETRSSSSPTLARRSAARPYQQTRSTSLRHCAGVVAASRPRSIALALSQWAAIPVRRRIGLSRRFTAGRGVLVARPGVRLKAIAGRKAGFFDFGYYATNH